LKHAKNFLSEGAKVKAYVFFKGRSILFKEQGEVLLLRFANDLEDYAKVEQLPALEGKKMIIMLSPKKLGASSSSSVTIQKKPVKPTDSTEQDIEDFLPEIRKTGLVILKKNNNSIN
jgi:translation initiation factor IF-3